MTEPASCDWCGTPAPTPVRDQAEAGWLGKAAATYCTRECLDAAADAAVEAEAAT